MRLAICPEGPGRSSFSGEGMCADVIIPQESL